MIYFYLMKLKIIATSCNFTQKKKHPTNKRKKTAGAKQNQIVEILLNYYINYILTRSANYL